MATMIDFWTAAAAAFVVAGGPFAVIALVLDGGAAALDWWCDRRATPIDPDQRGLIL